MFLWDSYLKLCWNGAYKQWYLALRVSQLMRFSRYELYLGQVQPFFGGPGEINGISFISVGKNVFGIRVISITEGIKLVSQGGCVCVLWYNRYVICLSMSRWVEAHHESEAVGSVWGAAGEVWVAVGAGGSVQWLPPNHVGVCAREKSYCSTMLAASLDQLLTHIHTPEITLSLTFCVLKVSLVTYTQVYTHFSECIVSIKAKLVGWHSTLSTQYS